MKGNFTKIRALMVPLLVVLLGAATQALGTARGTFETLRQITGTVTDESNQPLPGVSIIEKNTRKGTVTDQNGRYALEVAEGSVLTFSFIGFITQEISVTTQSTLNVQLKENVSMLEEVVAVGYQTMRKSDLTGAISSVKAKELNLTAPTVGQSLVGKVAGVQIAQVSGAPYVGTKIRVRGVGSINASSDPLYVIDGYPAGNDVFINPNDIESIDILKDAASAAIYGSRAAGGVVLITTKRGKEGKGRLEYDYMFGVHQLSKKVDLMNAEEFAQLVIDARNGTYRDLVVNAGKPWNDAMYSHDNPTRIANVGNASAVSIPTYLYDFPTQTMIKPQYDTDWQDALYRNAPVHRHNLAFSGGTQDVRYALSGGFQNQEGIILSTGQRRINFRGNVDANINKKLRVGVNLALTSSDNREVQEGRFNQGPILGALVYMPFFRAYNEDGTLAKYEAASQQAAYGFQSIENPVALATETKITRKGLRGTYNGHATYEILPGLAAKVNLGMQTYNEKYEYYLPTSLSSGANPPGSPQAIAAARATAQTLAQQDQLAEFTLNYRKQLGKHSADLLAGYTAQQTTSDVISVSAQGFQNDRIPEITGKGADPAHFFMNSGTGKSTHTLLSYLARAVYQYDNRYFLTGSFRTDGSSRFGPLNRWGYFPSVSAGWNISNESFYAGLLGTASTMKLRASWGLSGNNNIGNYNHEQVMANPGGVVFGTNTIATAMWSGNLRDQNLGWESTSQYNVGLDLGLFNDRLQVISNFYLSNSFNLLFNQSISAVSGASTMLTNLRDSKVQNKGFDLQLDGRVISSRDFNLNLSGNFSLNRNKVLDMGGASTIRSTGAERSYVTHVTQTGQPIGMFYGFKVMGMVRESDLANIALDNENFNAATQSFPAGYVLKGPARSAASSNPLKPGDLYFEDVNGDGIVNDEDKRVIGNPHPKFTYGLSLTMSYKNFDFSAAFNGSYGNQVLDGQDYYIYNLEGSGNQYSKVNERYRSEAEPGNGWVYRAARGGTQSNSTRLSTFYLQDGSFFRCTNLTLGYTLPGGLRALGLSNLRLYASVDNAFTFSKYLGYNPEVDYNNGANLTPGVDYGKYPLVRGFNLGAKVVF
ncbi:TonB-dependent receptor [Rhabdobacter roseus]|uniref:TonB-linked SusC/RagA family outer membrane protein n=1 Tax=Rhabdobacter roseus TaxID=1655419 RepID=A0A840TT06_9BACT|nr:TonB-dependent receptor [Rhabdobacter roseus]MBB5284403.1 TonB-linked SusC/RagA family outer membrane protein [Rhabdobacter roseus]